jgi:hypothetical protein
MLQCKYCLTNLKDDAIAKQHARVCKPKRKLKQKINKCLKINKETETYKLEHVKKTKRNCLNIKQGAKTCRFVPYERHDMTPAYLKLGKHEVKVLVHILPEESCLLIQPEELLAKYEFERLFRLPMIRGRGKKLKKYKFAIKVFQ